MKHLIPQISPWLPLLAATFFAGSPRAARAEVTEEFKQTYPLAAGGKVGLENANGPVRILAAAEGAPREVRVEAVKRGRDAEDLRSVQIRVEARPDSVQVHTDYESEKSGRGRHASVDYTVTVPRDAALDRIVLANGGLEIEGVAGGVTATCTNGRLAARDLAGGSVDLHATNGELSASLRALASGGEVRLANTNGSVKLALPADAGARVEAQTVNGSIRNDFGLSEKGEQVVGHTLKGQLGDGSARVRLSTVNGSIALTRDGS